MLLSPVFLALAAQRAGTVYYSYSYSYVALCHFVLSKLFEGIAENIWDLRLTIGNMWR